MQNLDRRVPVPSANQRIPTPRKTPSTGPYNSPPMDQCQESSRKHIHESLRDNMYGRSFDVSHSPSDPHWTLCTADDTEQRLIGSLPPVLAALVSFSAMVRIGSLPDDAGQNPSTIFGLGDQLPPNWASHMVEVRVNWEIAPDDQRSRYCRPSLAPQPWKAIPSLHFKWFQTWRSTAPLTSAVEATALEAGLRQFYDDLDGSHQCAQSIEGQGRRHGDYWHAIMHRREPDYGNSQYWFRRVGNHPVFTPLAQEAKLVADQLANARFAKWLPRLTANGTWHPMAFVDCVAAAAEGNDESFFRVVEEVQYREMLLLFAQTYRDAMA